MKSVKVLAARYKRKSYKFTLTLIDKIFQSNLAWKYIFRVNGYHNTLYRFEKNEIAFIHMPKTGGTTFYHLLQADPSLRFINLNVHRPISLYCDPAEFKYVTIMRNPVSRVWSLYQMELNNPPGFPYKKFALNGLEHFLKNCWEARNMASRYYSGIMEKEPDNQILEKALVNLNAFYAVLSFDNLTEDIQSFLREHNIQKSIIPHKRPSSYSPPSQADIDIITRYNQVDIKLFENWENGQ